MFEAFSYRVLTGDANYALYKNIKRRTRSIGKGKIPTPQSKERFHLKIVKDISMIEINNTLIAISEFYVDHLNYHHHLLLNRMTSSETPLQMC